jgi:hypothetical protein
MNCPICNVEVVGGYGLENIETGEINRFYSPCGCEEPDHLTQLTSRIAQLEAENERLLNEREELVVAWVKYSARFKPMHWGDCAARNPSFQDPTPGCSCGANNLIALLTALE